MKNPRPLKPAIEILAKEMAEREALDPKFFNDLKQQSLEQANKLGLDLEVMKKLLDI